MSVPAIGKCPVLGTDSGLLLNRLTNMVDAAGTTKYTYYAGGLPWTEGGLWASDTVTDYYYSARMRSGLGLAQPTSSWTNGFTYDGGHRLSTVISPAGTFAYGYKVQGTWSPTWRCPTPRGSPTRSTRSGGSPARGCSLPAKKGTFLSRRGKTGQETG